MALPLTTLLLASRRLHDEQIYDEVLKKTPRPAFRRDGEYTFICNSIVWNGADGMERVPVPEDLGSAKFHMHERTGP